MTVEGAPKQAEIRSLTSVRGIAALFVFVFHFRMFFPDLINHSLAGPIIVSGYIWVDFFFILSGFILTHVYGGMLTQKAKIKKFAIARLARVVPLHWVILITLMIIELGFLSIDINSFGEKRSIYDFFMSFFLIHGWGFPSVDNWPWNAPSWSISTEMFCYLLFPLFLYVAKTYSHMILIIIMLAGYAFMAQYEAAADSYNTPLQLMLFRTVPAFILGILIYDFRHLPRQFSTLLLSTLQVTLVLLIFFVLVSGISKLWLMPCFAGLILSLFHDRGIIAILLSMGGVHYLGVISYAVYMIHYPIRDYWIRFTNIGGDYGGWMAAFAMFIITILLSMLAYHYIENPARKRIRNFGKRCC